MYAVRACNTSKVHGHRTSVHTALIGLAVPDRMSAYNWYCVHVTCVQGVQLTIRGTTKTVYGTLVAVCGDNLGSQLLGGYKQLASSIRKCRYCMATKSDINTKVSDSTVVLSR